MTAQENNHNHLKEDSSTDHPQDGPSPKVSSKEESKEIKPEDKPKTEELRTENTKAQIEEAQSPNQDTSLSSDDMPEKASQSQDLPESSLSEKSLKEKPEVKTEDKKTDIAKAQADQATEATEAKEQTEDPADQEVSKIKEEKAIEQVAAEKEELPELHLNGLYALKVGMSSIYNKQGQIVPVTVLKFDTWKVTQIKTREKDGYTAIQLGSKPKSQRKSNLAQKGHLMPSGFSTNVTFLCEIRGEVPPQPSLQTQPSSDLQQDTSVKLGQILSIHSLAKGDRVHLSSFSKGRGFAGTMKRWGYSGGPASHGSQFHRKPGSIGMCEEPARVIPGKGMPGHYGSRKVTLKHVEVIDVIPEKKVLLVKGCIPGARNSLVKLIKENG